MAQVLHVSTTILLTSSLLERLVSLGYNCRPRRELWKTGSKANNSLAITPPRPRQLLNSLKFRPLKRVEKRKHIVSSIWAPCSPASWVQPYGKKIALVSEIRDPGLAQRRGKWLQLCLPCAIPFLSGHTSGPVRGPRGAKERPSPPH